MDAGATRAPGVVGGVSCALDGRKETEASSRRWPVPGRAGVKDSPDAAQTLQRTHKPLSQAWDGNTDKNTNPRAGRVSFPTETCKHSRGYSIFFPQDFSERNHQDVTQEVVFSFLLFHGNLSQHYHLL